MTQLRKLAVYTEIVRADGIASLAGLKELRNLKLRDYETEHDVEYLNEFVNLFTHLKKLEEVDLATSKHLSAEVIESLVINNPNLRLLDISQLDSLSSNDIQNLITACPKLTRANFFWTHIDDTALALLSHNCPELEHLSLRECRNVSEQGVKGFITKAAKLTKLRFLDIRHLESANPGFAKRMKQEHPDITIATEDDDDDSDIDTLFNLF